MEKATDKQIDFIKDLSEKHQVTCENLDSISKEEAWAWIQDVLNGTPEPAEELKVKVNLIQWGLALKMVYLKAVENGINPLDFKTAFIKEVKETYLLFEYK